MNEERGEAYKKVKISLQENRKRATKVGQDGEKGKAGGDTRVVERGGGTFGKKIKKKRG